MSKFPHEALPPEDEDILTERIKGFFDAEKATQMEREIALALMRVLSATFYNLALQVVQRTGISAEQAERVTQIAFKGTVLHIEYYIDKERQ